MGKYKRKRSLNTSSDSSNSGNLSMNKSIAEEKSNVKLNTQHENQEIVSNAVCEDTASQDAFSEGNFLSDSDEAAPNSFYNSSGNIRHSNDKEEIYFESYIDTLARKRSQSLESRTEQTKTTPHLVTKTKGLIKENFLKVVPPPRSLDGQRC